MKRIQKDRFDELRLGMTKGIAGMHEDVKSGPKENAWIEFDPADWETHPEDGSWIEAQYQDGHYREATYSRVWGDDANQTPVAEPILKCWRYR
jgi:hypothetical protein